MSGPTLYDESPRRRPRRFSSHNYDDRDRHATDFVVWLDRPRPCQPSDSGRGHGPDEGFMASLGATRRPVVGEWETPSTILTVQVDPDFDTWPNGEPVPRRPRSPNGQQRKRRTVAEQYNRGAHLRGKAR